MQGKNIESLSELVSIIGSNFNILEEEIDIEVQKDYILLAHKIKQDPEFSTKQQKYFHDTAVLFDENTPDEEKKYALIALAQIAEPAAYRAIEMFVKAETPLKPWGVIALQQSRILLNTSLSDNPGVFISTGLGGQGMLMRFFAVIFYSTPEAIAPYQQDLVTNETARAIKKAGGKVEQLAFEKAYITLLVLMPLDSELSDILAKIIEECNQYGHFLYEKAVVTNVKKLSEEEISAIVQKQFAPVRRRRPRGGAKKST